MQTYGDLNTMSCVANSDIIFCNDEHLWAIFKEKDKDRGLALFNFKTLCIILNGVRFKAEGIKKKNVFYLSECLRNKHTYETKTDFHIYRRDL